MEPYIICYIFLVELIGEGTYVFGSGVSNYFLLNCLKGEKPLNFFIGKRRTLFRPPYPRLIFSKISFLILKCFLNYRITLNPNWRRNSSFTTQISKVLAVVAKALTWVTIYHLHPNCHHTELNRIHHNSSMLNRCF